MLLFPHNIDLAHDVLRQSHQNPVKSFTSSPHSWLAPIPLKVATVIPRLRIIVPHILHQPGLLTNIQHQTRAVLEFLVRHHKFDRGAVIRGVHSSGGAGVGLVGPEPSLAEGDDAVEARAAHEEGMVGE